MIGGIVWPDVAEAFVDYMGLALAARPEAYADGVRVSGRRTSAARQVVVRDDGGRSVADVRATARIGVTVVAETDEVAADLARLVAALVGAWPSGEPVVAVESVGLPAPIAGPSEVPERYLTAALIVRGASV